MLLANSTGPAHFIYNGSLPFELKWFCTIRIEMFFRSNAVLSIQFELISVVSNPKGGTERSLSESGVDAFSMFSIELELISGVANPKGGNRALSIRIRGRCIFHVFD